MKRQKIIVIGTGYVGLPAALMWAKAGFPVYPSFRAGAQAFGRVRAYYEELEARTR